MTGGCSDESKPRKATFLNNKQYATLDSLLKQHLNSYGYNYDNLGNSFVNNDSNKNVIYIFEEHRMHGPSGYLHLFYLTNHIEQYISFDLERDSFYFNADSIYHKEEKIYGRDMAELWYNVDTNYCRIDSSGKYRDIYYFSKMDEDGNVSSKIFYDLYGCVTKYARAINGSDNDSIIPRKKYFDLLSLRAKFSNYMFKEGVSAHERRKEDKSCLVR